MAMFLFSADYPNEVLFVDYMKHVIKCEIPCKKDPFLLNLDSHKTHLSIPATNVAK